MEYIFELSLTVVTALLLGVVQVFKSLGLPTKYAPLVSVVLGMLATVSLAFFEPTTKVIFTGIAIGLAASGLFSFSKETSGVVVGAVTKLFKK